LRVFDVDQNYKVLQIIREDDGARLESVTWLNDHRLALAFSKMVYWKEFFRIEKRMVLMDADGSKLTQTFENQPDVHIATDLTQIVNLLPDQEHHILVSLPDINFSLYKVNIGSGSAERWAVGNKRTKRWSVNRDGDPTLRFDYFPASKKIEVYAPKEGEFEWEKVAERTEDDSIADLLAIGGSGSNSEIFVLDRREGDEYISLYEIDPITRELGNKRIEVAGLDLLNAITSEVTGEVMGVSYIDDRIRYRYLDEAVQVVQDRLDEIFPDGDVIISSGSEWMDRFLVYVTTPTSPGIYYLYDRWTDKATKIAQRISGVPEKRATQTDRFTYAAEDGQKIDAYITYPYGVDSSQLPLVVYPHEFPHSRTWKAFDLFVQSWATLGYVVFQPNYRGSFGYGSSFFDGIRKSWGSTPIQDIALGIKAIGDAKKANTEKVCAVGMGFGGYAALQLAATTDLLDCVISINGHSNLPNLYSNLVDSTEGEERDEVIALFAENIGDPVEDKESLIDYSPVYRASDFSAATLLMHSDPDLTNPFSEGKAMHKALRKAGKKSKLVRIDGRGNSEYSPAMIKKVLKKTEKFLGKHLQR